MSGAGASGERVEMFGVIFPGVSLRDDPRLLASTASR